MRKKWVKCNDCNTLIKNKKIKDHLDWHKFLFGFNLDYRPLETRIKSLSKHERKRLGLNNA